MRYPAPRHTPATSLVGMLCLAASLPLAVVAAPTNAATPTEDSSEDKASIEIAIKSDDKVTTTFLTTAPASREEALKEFCVEKSFSKANSKPKVTFSNENGTPTCRATFTTSISGNNYVSHDGDEYVVDTHVDSASEADKNSSVALSVIFPGKVTDADGGKVDGDERNKVSFDTFYDHKTRGQDAVQAASQPQSTSSSDSRTGLMIITVALVVIAVVGGVIALIGNANKKSREQRYLAALEQQPLRAGAFGPQYRSQLGYSPAPQPYQQTYQQGHINRVTIPRRREPVGCTCHRTRTVTAATDLTGTWSDP